MFNNANSVGLMATTPLVREVDHLIIGAGFAGLCAAIKLQEAGETDFVVIEKGHDVGGTWRDNTYPGAECDVPSQLYSYSFAPNPELVAVLLPAAGDPGLHQAGGRAVRHPGPVRLRHLRRRRRPGTTPGSAGWWRRPAAPTPPARVISGAGGLSEPKLPEIEGIETFQGEVFHSARWNHDVDLTGKRVAVIGTGASAIQIVPAIQEKVGHLDVYQRTAPYVMPRNDRPYTGLEKAAFKRIPGVQSLYRTAIYWGRETYVPGFTLQPKLAWPAKQLALKNIQRGIDDPELREKVTPTFEIGCKRILISNTYYPALNADNVDLVTDGIAKVTGDAIVTQDGVERPIDVLIVATGFYTTELPITEHITGRSGQTLAEKWRETGMAAYKGTTVADFPNLFFIVGPNTGLGHSSMVFMIESQVTYIVDAVRTMRAHDYATVEVTEDAAAEYNADVQRRMKRTVWTHRRLRQLVPRLPRQQHHAVAADDVRVPRPDGELRHRRLPGRRPDRRPGPSRRTRSQHQ